MGNRHGEPAAVLTQLPAGALRVISGPRSEKPTLLPACRSPATAITPLQFAGMPTACPAEFPADATITAPTSVISLTAAWYAAVHRPSLPRLKLITRAGVGLIGTPGTFNPAAHRIPAMMSESKPPHL